MMLPVAIYIAGAVKACRSTTVKKINQLYHVAGKIFP
jgi:hypothetical protein